MHKQFHSFVIFAEMRTGSNLLEATINAVKGITCFGEAFNPYLMGWPNTDTLKNMTLAERDENPQKLLEGFYTAPTMNGFRYFHDHDPRILDLVMAEPGCAKIILTRNPIDSFVSTRLAWETDQWKLNETETPIPAAITFDGAEFRQVTGEIEQFQLRVLRGLQTTGQAAFWLNYDDLRDADVMTGLMHWLGFSHLDRVEPATDLVPQNPRGMQDKVINHDEMRDDLAQMDPFALSRIPTYEPRRGPAVPSFVASDAGGGMLFLPIRGGPTGPLRGWMKEHGPLRDDFTQNSLRHWLRDNPRHRSFTVLRHPVRRAWSAFDHLVSGKNDKLRQLMRDIYRVDLPPDPELATMSDDDKARHFVDFLGFLRRNLNGQTTLPVHPAWASQFETLNGFARFTTPDMVLREGSLARDLGWFAQSADLDDARVSALNPAQFPAFLADKSILQATRSAYQRDYVMLGFTNQL